MDAVVLEPAIGQGADYLIPDHALDFLGPYGGKQAPSPIVVLKPLGGDLVVEAGVITWGCAVFSDPANGVRLDRAAAFGADQQVSQPVVLGAGNPLALALVEFPLGLDLIPICF